MGFVPDFSLNHKFNQTCWHLRWSTVLRIHFPHLFNDTALNHGAAASRAPSLLQSRLCWCRRCCDPELNPILRQNSCISTGDGRNSNPAPSPSRWEILLAFIEFVNVGRKWTMRFVNMYVLHMMSGKLLLWKSGKAFMLTTIDIQTLAANRC